MTLYYTGAFTPTIRSTIVWTEKFNNGLCIHFLRLRGLKSSRNSSRLNNRRCELSLSVYGCMFVCLHITLLGMAHTEIKGARWRNIPMFIQRFHEALKGVVNNGLAPPIDWVWRPHL